MKFNYEYRTSDNAKHSGVVAAVSRDAAYVTLKSHGIRPERVTEAPGICNKIFGKGKRWIAIVSLGVLAAVLYAAFMRTSHQLRDLQQTMLVLPRHQIYGDPSIMGTFKDSGFADVFDCEGERFMAHYAQPGDERVLSAPPRISDELLRASLTNVIEFVKDEPREAHELKQIVNWMKDELRDYFDRGGSCSGYCRALILRQVEESRIRKRVEQELVHETSDAVWAAKNQRLRELGIAAIVRDDAALNLGSDSPLTRR